MAKMMNTSLVLVPLMLLAFVAGCREGGKPGDSFSGIPQTEHIGPLSLSLDRQYLAYFQSTHGAGRQAAMLMVVEADNNLQRNTPLSVINGVLNFTWSDIDGHATIVAVVATEGPHFEIVHAQVHGEEVIVETVQKLGDNIIRHCRANPHDSRMIIGLQVNFASNSKQEVVISRDYGRSFTRLNVHGPFPNEGFLWLTETSFGAVGEMGDILLATIDDDVATTEVVATAGPRLCCTSGSNLVVASDRRLQYVAKDNVTHEVDGSNIEDVVCDANSVIVKAGEILYRIERGAILQQCLLPEDYIPYVWCEDRQLVYAIKTEIGALVAIDFSEIPCRIVDFP